MLSSINRRTVKVPIIPDITESWSDYLCYIDEIFTEPQRLFGFSLFEGPKTSDKVLQWHFLILDINHPFSSPIMNK